jgi:nitrate reductase delta subunit
VPPAAPPAPDVATFDALASLLDYPDEGFPARVGEARTALLVAAPGAARALEGFFTYASRAAATELQEEFTRVFDWNPTRCLEVGWHLYGEQYDRGAFLVRMRGLLRDAGVEEGAELPDHLGTLLRLLGRLEPGAAAALAAESLGPALERMAKGFEGPTGPYGDVVRAARAAVVALAPPDGGDRCKG